LSRLVIGKGRFLFIRHVLFHCRRWLYFRSTPIRIIQNGLRWFFDRSDHARWLGRLGFFLFTRDREAGDQSAQ
jgi:hypothetical protein